MAAPKSTVNLNEIEVGDIFSESSHYIVTGISSTGVTFNHLASGQSVTLDNKYVTDLLSTGDQYQSEVKVGKEDKLWTAKQIADAVKKGTLAADHEVRVGDLKEKGLRSIFEDIHSSECFTVCFLKQETVLSPAAYKKKIDAEVVKALATIEATKVAKKGVAKTAQQVIEDLLYNPIQKIEPGEERILRGFKVEFTSRDGRYNCIDMDLPEGNNVRPVNINTLQWIVIRGVKYIQE